MTSKIIDVDLNGSNKIDIAITLRGTLHDFEMMKYNLSKKEFKDDAEYYNSQEMAQIMYSIYRVIADSLEERSHEPRD